MYGEFEYLHECRALCYGYNTPNRPAVEPGNTAHSWRSWLNFHYYATHSLGPLMQITDLRPVRVSALPEAVSLPGYLPESGMSKPCPSVIEMSNGGLMRNLTGAATGDYHAGKRIWGTRASAESLGHDLIYFMHRSVIGQRMESLRNSAQALHTKKRAVHSSTKHLTSRTAKHRQLVEHLECVALVLMYRWHLMKRCRMLSIIREMQNRKQQKSKSQ